MLKRWSAVGIAVSLVLFAPSVSALAQSDQFNLRCKGMTTSSTSAARKTEPYETLYRIDLAQKKWCENDCPALYNIASVQPTQITLQDDKQDTPSEQSQSSNFIIRTTGKHHALSSAKYRDLGILVLISWDGQCQREDFSGFPPHSTMY